MLAWLPRHAGAGVPLPLQRPRRRLSAGQPRFGVHYELLNRDRVERIRVRAALGGSAAGAGRPDAKRRAASIDPRRSLPTAEFHEREVYDFFGSSSAAPGPARSCCRRILWLAAAPRLPVRRRAVTFTYNEHHRSGEDSPVSSNGGDGIEHGQRPGLRRRPARRDHRDGHRRLAGRAHARPASCSSPSDELLTINLGPHPPRPRVLRLLVSLQGEEVIDLKPIVGYVHAGSRSRARTRPRKVIPFVERMDTSSSSQLQAFCAAAVEQLLELRRSAARRLSSFADAPPRAQPAALPPVLARLGLDLGACRCSGTRCSQQTPSWICSTMSTGQRMQPRVLPGCAGIRGHPAGVRAQAARLLRSRCRPGSTSTRRSSTANEIFLQRTQGVGIVSRETVARARRHRPLRAR